METEGQKRLQLNKGQLKAELELELGMQFFPQGKVTISQSPSVGESPAGWALDLRPFKGLCKLLPCTFGICLPCLSRSGH